MAVVMRGMLRLGRPIKGLLNWRSVVGCGLWSVMMGVASISVADENSVFFPTALTTLATLRAQTWSAETSDSRNNYSYEVKEDAAAFVASDGAIRGPYLEMAISDIRESHPSLGEHEIARSLLSR